MNSRASFLGLVLAVGVFPVSAQMMGPEAEQAQAKQPMQAAGDASQQDMPATDAASEKASKTFAAKARGAGMPAVATAPAKSGALVPLGQRDRVLQLLNRFTFGAKPGEIDRVMAVGADKWLAQQLNPDSIADGAADKRLADYPTLLMPVDVALKNLPDNGMIYAVGDGRVPYPSDPLLNCVYEVQVYKWNLTRDRKKADGTTQTAPQLTDAEKDAQHKADVETARRVAGDLFSLPKQQRMAALIKLPVEERVAFTGNVGGDQRTLLLADFSPREKEAFNSMAANGQPAGIIGNELQQARLVRDILTERQLQEVMTNFWFNHFNVFLGKDADTYYTTSYERDVIRKHALGTFKDLLLATAESPAMMVYLDNYLSIGPDSIANGVNPANPNSKRGGKGLNENYGREVMELHTVGVNGGYSQADVTALSAILTGWGVDRANQGGPFVFDPKRHEPGPKYWFGYEIADDGTVMGKGVPAKGGVTFGPSLAGSAVATPASMQQGVTALTILAAAPQTAHFICYLLAQSFVADVPPPALVDRLAKVYLTSGGDIRTILRALIASPEFNSKQYFRNKVKTPVEFVASAFRSTATDPQNAGALVSVVHQMGMPMYYALPPTGYYITADQWMNSAALVDRLNFAYQLTNNKFANQKFDAPRLLAMGLLMPSNNLPAVKASANPTGGAHVMGVSAVSGGSGADTPQAGVAGTDVALRVLEATMIGGTVSPMTNTLIHKQIDQQPVNTSPTDMLNLLTALVMGSPEFQLR